MSAQELIKQVAALPLQERMLFERLFHTMENGDRAGASPGERNWPDFGERLRRIYGDRIAPDSQHIIDDGRGER